MLEHLFNQSTKATYSADSTDTNDEIDLATRLRDIQSADPDPYGLHKIPIETRLVYMEHYLITGNYLI